MVLKDDKIYLEHILDEIRRIEAFLENWNESSFLSSEVTAEHYAAVRSLEIIGEAASKVSPKYRRLYSELPWRDMIDMRNKVIHEYLNVDYKVVWDTVTKDLPALKKQVENILKS